jgi:hypothetical protein
MFAFSGVKYAWKQLNHEVTALSLRNEEKVFNAYNQFQSNFYESKNDEVTEENEAELAILLKEWENNLSNEDRQYLNIALKKIEKKKQYAANKEGGVVVTDVDINASDSSGKSNNPTTSAG